MYALQISLFQRVLTTIWQPQPWIAFCLTFPALFVIHPSIDNADNRYCSEQAPKCIFIIIKYFISVLFALIKTNTFIFKAL